MKTTPVVSTLPVRRRDVTLPGGRIHLRRRSGRSQAEAPRRSPRDPDLLFAGQGYPAGGGLHRMVAADGRPLIDPR